ncbi:MAG: cell division protein ZapA [Lachnospiraceae bacterium]|nr:cell division protein ZapA [Lachnospiraceae bacterium]MBR6271142.1 cell division protein ZapA [Lachnospiraceae bacterium]
MNKAYSEVIIGGKTYTIAGYENEEYLQSIATYINAKLSELKKTEGYNRQNADYRNMLLLINLADDSFRERKRASALQTQNELLEKEIYNLKHELIAGRMHKND